MGWSPSLFVPFTSRPQLYRSCLLDLRVSLCLSLFSNVPFQGFLECSTLENCLPNEELVLCSMIVLLNWFRRAPLKRRANKHAATIRSSEQQHSLHTKCGAALVSRTECPQPRREKWHQELKGHAQSGGCIGGRAPANFGICVTRERSIFVCRTILFTDRSSRAAVRGSICKI